MPWRRGAFRGDAVWVQVDAAGRPLGAGGRVPIRYSLGENAKVYRAGLDKVTVDADAPLEEPARRAPAAGPGGSGSGFGKAGTRTKEQAMAAAAHARSRIAGLAEG